MHHRRTAIVGAKILPVAAAAVQLLLLHTVRVAGILTAVGPDGSGGEFRAFNVSAAYVTAEPAAASMVRADDLQCLSELPVDKLLRIRQTLRLVSHMLDDRGGGGGEGSADGSAPTLLQHSYPSGQRRIGPAIGRQHGAVGRPGGHGTHGAHAAPLMMDNIKSRVGYDEPGWPDEKPSKVQKIFQLSVTTLAFLAFGGYLLCMIVQAIKSKGTTYFHPALMPMVTSTGGDAGLAQISQISIRKRRPVRIKRRATSGEDRAGPSPDELYNILALAAEGYVRMSALQ